MSTDASWAGRLASQHPGVAALLAEVPRERQLVVAEAAAHLACSVTGLSRPTGSLPVIERLVQELDEKAWDLQDADSEQYPDAFAAARAANAWLHLAEDSDPNPAEALFEALAAIRSEAPVFELFNA